MRGRLMVHTHDSRHFSVEMDMILVKMASAVCRCSSGEGGEWREQEKTAKVQERQTEARGCKKEGV